jgi:hypothetical protein
MPAKPRKPGKINRRHLGLTGSTLIHTVNSLRKQGLNEKEIRKRCGYQDPVYFQRILDTAHAATPLRGGRPLLGTLQRLQHEQRSSLPNVPSWNLPRLDSRLCSMCCGWARISVLKALGDGFNVAPNLQGI